MDSCLIFNYVHNSYFFSDFLLVRNFHYSHFFSGKSFLMCQDSLTADYLITSFATLLERVYIYNLCLKNTIRQNRQIYKDQILHFFLRIFNMRVRGLHSVKM